MENLTIAETFYNNLQTGINPINTLSFFCISLFEGLNIDNTFYNRLGKLIKIYGKNLVYYSILDCTTVDNIDSAELINYIAYNCKKRFEGKQSPPPFNDLTDMIKDIKKSLGKI